MEGGREVGGEDLGVLWCGRTVSEFCAGLFFVGYLYVFDECGYFWVGDVGACRECCCCIRTRIRTSSCLSLCSPPHLPSPALSRAHADTSRDCTRDPSSTSPPPSSSSTNSPPPSSTSTGSATSSTSPAASTKPSTASSSSPPSSPAESYGASTPASGCFGICGGRYRRDTRALR